MTDKIVVFTTCNSQEQAAQLARHLIEHRLAACATILPGARSFYRWKGEIENASEAVLMIKSRRDIFDKLSWNRSQGGRTWKVPRVFLAAAVKPKPYGIVIARVSEDFAVWLNSYNKVHEKTGQWIGAEMPTPPPGFEVLASVNVTRAAKGTAAQQEPEILRAGS